MSEGPKRLAVFAHWDKDAVVDPYVIHHLRALSRLCDIIFVSDSKLPERELEKLKPFTLAQLAEPHGEYDFGSYKRGWLHAADMLDGYDELVFVNDSCFGPFSPLEDMWTKMNQRECDFWGMLEHYHTTVDKWYVQSYFLVFRKPVFGAEVFGEFMRSIQQEEDKEAVIVNYEVGLTHALRGAGFKADSLFPRTEENMTHETSAFDLLDQGAPYLKKALLATNPLKAPMLIDRLKAYDRKLAGDALWAMMFDNLRRTAAKNHRKHWFYSPMARGWLFHPKCLRYKEKATRWMNYFSVKLGGITLAFIPWKINVTRIRFDLDRRTTEFDSPIYK